MVWSSDLKLPPNDYSVNYITGSSVSEEKHKGQASSAQLLG